MKPLALAPDIHLGNPISRWHIWWHLLREHFIGHRRLGNRVCDFLQTQKNVRDYLLNNYEQEPYLLVKIMPNSLFVYIYHSKGQTHSNERPYWMELESSSVACYKTTFGYIHFWNGTAPNNAGLDWQGLLIYDFPISGSDYFNG